MSRLSLGELIVFGVSVFDWSSTSPPRLAPAWLSPHPPPSLPPKVSWRPVSLAKASLALQGQGTQARPWEGLKLNWSVCPGDGLCGLVDCLSLTHTDPRNVQEPLRHLLPDPCCLHAPVSWAAASLRLRPGWCHLEHDSLCFAYLE